MKEDQGLRIHVAAKCSCDNIVWINGDFGCKRLKFGNCVHCDKFSRDERWKLGIKKFLLFTG